MENEVEYLYDTAGRLDKVETPSGLFTYGYEASSHGLVETVTGPVHTVTHTWEINRDVLDLKQNKVGIATVSSYDYVVNAIGQRTDVESGGSAFSSARAITWGYDALGQVTSADSSIPAHNRAYEYDAIGNRTKSADTLTLPGSANYTVNALNQYTTGTTATLVPVHDFDGNATAYPVPADLSANSVLVWDAENRLISAEVDGVTTTYFYDAQSRRIATTSGTGSILFIYDGWNPVAEYSYSSLSTPTTALMKSYAWGLDLSGTLQGAGGVGGLLSVTEHTSTSSDDFYPTYDGNGNVSEYLDLNGSSNNGAHYEYDPFGRTVVATGTKAADFAHRFSTKPLDEAAGLYYYGYRYYDPLTGRWPSRDLIEEEGGLNLYGFVGNDPLNKMDLLGLFDPGTTALRLSRITGGIAMRGTPHGRAALIGLSIGLSVGNLIAPLLIPEPSDLSLSADEKQKAKDRKDYKKFEHESKPEPTGDEKTDLCNSLKHAKEVLKKREDFGKKWFDDGHHDPVNDSWNKRIENLNKEIAEKGICCDEE